MKNSILKLSLLIGLLASSIQASAQNVQDDLNSLGGNKDLIKKAKQMNPNNKVRIVQKREVDRNLRFEVGGSFGVVAGGDPYVNTDNLGFNLDFHITPRWSIGARYYQSSNALSREGKRLADEAQKNPDSNVFDSTDYAKDTYMGVINWYPIYGKLNLFDLTVAQFDIYALAGYGQIQLASGSTDTITAGGGVGIWLSQHFSTRLEARYQSYSDQPISGSRPLDLTVLSMSIGLLL